MSDERAGRIVSDSDKSSGASMYLVARPDGRDAKVMRSVSARGAVLGRVKDDDDVVWDGVWAVWRLGNFPTQFEVDGLDSHGHAEARELGRPHV